MPSNPPPHSQYLSATSTSCPPNQTGSPVAESRLAVPPSLWSHHPHTPSPGLKMTLNDKTHLLQGLLISSWPHLSPSCRMFGTFHIALP